PWMTICSRRIGSPDAGASMDTTATRKVQEKTPTDGGRPGVRVLDGGADRSQTPLRRQHFLYFFPDPQGQGSLRPTFVPVATRGSLGEFCPLLPWLSRHRGTGARAGAA